MTDEEIDDGNGGFFTHKLKWCIKSCEKEEQSRQKTVSTTARDMMRGGPIIVYSSKKLSGSSTSNASPETPCSSLSVGYSTSQHAYCTHHPRVF